MLAKLSDAIMVTFDEMCGQKSHRLYEILRSQALQAHFMCVSFVCGNNVGAEGRSIFRLPVSGLFYCFDAQCFSRAYRC